MSSFYKPFHTRCKSSKSPDQLDEDGPISSTTDCYACTQVGVPVFHPIPHFPDSKLSPNPSTKHNGAGVLIFDPRSKRVQRWNRFFVLARVVALAIDPFFFYTLSIGIGDVPCLYMDGVMAAVVAMVRTLVDVVHVVYMWLQFRTAYVSRESLVVGRGKLVWDLDLIGSHYLRSIKGFWYDLLVVLPLPQVVFWLVVPRLIREERIKETMTIVLFIFVVQFLPKVYHSISLMRSMAKVTGYIFGTVSWGFALNLIAYFIASHVTGGCWYALSIQRVVLCLSQQCNTKDTCNVALSCVNKACDRFLSTDGTFGDRCASNSTTRFVRNSMCLDIDGPYEFGIYGLALPVISSTSLSVKILYPIFWGLMMLSTFGNDLEPTSQLVEVIFSICIVLCGLMLFTLLVSNIQEFLYTVMVRKIKMQLRCHDMEWWMKRRQLPSLLRKRVRHYEEQNWALIGGEDEVELLEDLPEGLRRDIKRFLCLELIRKVRLFKDLDDLILDNICDRAKPLVFSKNEKIIREGDLVQRMVFIVHGRVKSSQSLRKGVAATSIVNPGDYLGDELLSWCVRRPFTNRLPSSSATFTCMEPIEAFGLDANHLRYVTDHFRYKFANDRLKRSVRYYSSNWRTWAAVNIQLRWRHYMVRMRRAVPEDNGGSNHMLRKYATIFMSVRPHDHIE